jgi:hypothetical protein
LARKIKVGMRMGSIEEKKVPPDIDIMEEQIRREIRAEPDPNDGPELKEWRGKRDRALRVIDPD